MRIFFSTLKILFLFYLLICLALFLLQEKLIFFPEKLPKDFKFTFDSDFEELKIEAPDHTLLSGVLFKTENSKGLIFYLHGNAGSIHSWGGVAKTYTDLQYDVFLLDYRGYGKSEGKIRKQEELFLDVQFAYDQMKKRYPESKISLLGYSLGSGLAAKLAADNSPKLLILQAPYYSMTDMMRHTYPIIPTFLLRYKLRTDQFIQGCKTPIVIFHGKEDEVIYYGSSVKLQKLMKPTDRLVTLEGLGHNGMTEHPQYKWELQKILVE